MKELEFYKDRKVLVTGHTGFKGAWLCRILSLAGARVTGFSLEPPTDPNLFELCGISKGIDSVRGDVRDLDALKRCISSAAPEILFHLAAQPIVRASYDDPVGTYATNVMGTVNLLESCRGLSSVRSVVNVTTDKVYENREWCWGYRENENLCGRDPYSNSKSCSELVTHSYRTSFFNEEGSAAVSTARSGNVIGGGDFARDRIVADFVRAASEGVTLQVRNPFSIRPYQHVLDCLYGYLLLAERQYSDGALAGSYNFGPETGDCVSTSALVEMLCAEWGKGASWNTISSNGPHEASFLRLDCSKARTALGWAPRLSLRDAVRLTVEWSRAWNSGGDAVRVLDGQISEFFGGAV